MVSITNIITSTTIYGCKGSSTSATLKLFNSNQLFNSKKTKINFNKNFNTLTTQKNEFNINKINNNSKINTFSVINYKIKNLNSWKQINSFSIASNNLFLNESTTTPNNTNKSYTKLTKNFKPTINTVIRNLTNKITFANASEKVIGTHSKWSGNLKNGFILLDEEDLTLQQLNNLFHGFFIYNGNNKRNKSQNYYYYNNRNSYNSKRHKKRKVKKFKFNNRNVFYTLLGLNLLVFAAWQYAIEQAQSYNNYKYYRFMEDNFCVSWDKVVKKKHWWTLVTSAFSHQEKMHFIMNMLVFNSFAGPVIGALGAENFLFLYLFTGVCSSLSHITFNHFIMPKMNKSNTLEDSVFDFFFPHHQREVYDSISSLGASGSIMGINTLFACLYPHSIIQYGMFFPLPAWLGMSLYTIMDIYRTATITNGRIDTAGHVGGALSGLLFYFIRIRPYIQKWKNFY